MSGRRMTPRPKTPEELMRWFDQRLEKLENKREVRVGAWVLSMRNGVPVFTKPGAQTLDAGQPQDPEVIDLGVDRDFVTAHDLSKAVTGTPGPLGPVQDYLTDRWHDLTTAGQNISDMITNALVGGPAAFGAALAGAVSNANTALTNAGSALSQLSAMISSSLTGGAAALGTALAGAVTNIQSTFDRFWEGIFGGSVSGKTVADLKTAAQSVNSAAATAGTNATNALTQLSSMITNAVSGTAANLGTMLATAGANIQNTWDRFWEGIFGGSVSGKTAADVKTAAQTVNSTANTGVTNAATAQSTASKAQSMLNTRLAAGPNLASNPGFENTNFPLVTSGTVTYSTEQSHSGAQSLKVIGRAAFTYAWFMADTTATSQRLPCQPGDVFYLEVWIRGHASNVQTSGGAAGVGLSLTIFDAAGTLLSTSAYASLTASTALNGVWTKATAYVVMPANAAFWTPFVAVQAAVPATEVYYFDDVVIKEYTYSQQLIDQQNQALVGGSATGNPLSTLKTNLQALNSTANTASTNATTGINNAAKAQAMLNASMAAASNLATNPGMEVANFTMANAVRSSVVAHSGTYSALLTGTGTSYPGWYVLANDTTLLTMPCQQGDVFYAEYWFYGDAANTAPAGSIFMQINCLNTAGGSVGFVQLAAVALTTAHNGVWTKLAGFGTIPAGTASASVAIYLNISTPAGYKYYIDDVVLKEYTYTQQVIDQQNQAIVGGSTTGNLLSTLKTNLQAMVSNANTAGTNATNALGQLSSMITNAAAGTAANLGTLLDGARTNIQNTWDRFWEGIFGGTVSGKTATDLKTAAQSVNSTANTGVTNAATAQTAATKAQSMLNAAIAKGANIVSDPGFENTNFVVTPNGAYSTEQAHGGTRSIKLIGNGSTAQVAYVTRSDVGAVPIPTVANDVFYIEAWVYGHASNVGGGSLYLGGTAKNAAGVDQGYPSITVPATTALKGVWTKISTYITMPANTAILYCWVQLSNAVPNGDAYYFDDVVIKEYTYEQQIIDQQNQAIVGGSTTGNLLSVLKTSLQSLTSNANTAGTNATNALGQLSSMITNAATGTAAALGTALANAGTNIQNTWDRFWEGIFGGSVSGKTAADVKTAAQSVNSTASTASTNAGTANTNIASMITNAAVGTAAALGSALSGAVNNIQSTFNGFWEGIFGGTASGKTAADLKTAAQNVNATANTGVSNAATAQSSVVATNTALFGTSTPGSAILPAATPDVGRAGLADLQALTDAVTAISGSSAAGSDAAAARAAVQSIPQKYVIPFASPATSVTPDAGQVASGWTPYLASSAATGPQVATGSHTFGSNANFLVVPVRFYGSATPSAYGRSVTVGATTMVSLGSYVASGIVTEFFGAYIPSPPATAQTVTVTVTPTAGAYLYFILAGSASYCNVAAVSAISTYTYVGGTPATLSQAVTSATNNYVVQAFATQRNNAAPGLTTYNKTVRYDSGDVAGFSVSGNTVNAHMIMGDAPGASTVTFTAASGNLSIGHGIAINLLATGGGIMGSGFRAWRNSTTLVTSTAANTETKLTGTFFDRDVNSAGPPSGVYKTSDLTWDTANNKLTVSYAGWYSVTLTLSCPANVSASFFWAILYINGSVARRSSSIYIPGGASAPGTFQLHADVYLNSGDYLEPGAERSIAGGAILTGSADGTNACFEVALTNRSPY